MPSATVIWINGCFGVGKTTVATKLVEMMPGSVLFDPEPLGSFIRRRASPTEASGDFQDIRLWRQATSIHAIALARFARGPVVVPMTLVVAGYAKEIFGTLKDAGVAVNRFSLVAPKATIEARLRGRPETTDWTYGQIDRCLAALEDWPGSARIETDGRSIEDIALEICRMVATKERPVHDPSITAPSVGLVGQDGS